MPSPYPLSIYKSFHPLPRNRPPNLPDDPLRWRIHNKTFSIYHAQYLRPCLATQCQKQVQFIFKHILLQLVSVSVCVCTRPPLLAVLLIKCQTNTQEDLTFSSSSLSSCYACFSTSFLSLPSPLSPALQLLLLLFHFRRGSHCSWQSAVKNFSARRKAISRVPPLPGRDSLA